MQRLEECKEIIPSKIDVKDVEKDHEIESSSVFSPIIEEICGQKKVNKVALLSCEHFNLVFSEKKCYYMYVNKPLVACMTFMLSYDEGEPPEKIVFGGLHILLICRILKTLRKNACIQKVMN